MNLSLSGGYLSFPLLESWGPLAITYDRRGTHAITPERMGFPLLVLSLLLVPY